MMQSNGPQCVNTIWAEASPEGLELLSISETAFPIGSPSQQVWTRKHLLWVGWTNIKTRCMSRVPMVFLPPPTHSLPSLGSLPPLLSLTPSFYIGPKNCPFRSIRHSLLHFLMWEWVCDLREVKVWCLVSLWVPFLRVEKAQSRSAEEFIFYFHPWFNGYFPSVWVLQSVLPCWGRVKVWLLGATLWSTTGVWSACPWWPVLYNHYGFQ